MKLPVEVVYTVAGLAIYLVGAIPFGFLAAKLFKGVDLRTLGSGNIGATNASRALGRGWFAPIFALDFLKGFAPVYWLAPWIAATWPCGHCTYLLAMLSVFCGVMALGGHLFPIYLGFKGGKGVATGAGVVFAINWVGGFASLAVFFVVLLLLRYVSVGSVVSAISLAPMYLATAPYSRWSTPGERWIFSVFLAGLTVAVIVKHRSNLGRVRRGEEPRVRFSSR